MKRALLLALLCSCDPQQASWGFGAIETMSTPADPPLTCGVTFPQDPLASARAACTFTAGAHPSDTLGVDKSVLAQIPIRHVIVIMKENRSFDHLLGKLHDHMPDVEAVPATYSNPDPAGNPVFPSHANTTCIKSDPGHQSQSVLACIDDGKMDGFVRNAAATTPTGTDPSFVMNFYDDTELPYDYWLAETFALGDRHFASTASGTFANRDFMLFGTNAGVVDTGISFPSPRTPSIFQTLIAAGFTWGVYTDTINPDDTAFPLSGTLDWTMNDPGVHPTSELLDALQNGTHPLPNVVFVDGAPNNEDDHPPDDLTTEKGNLQQGEAWTKKIVDAAMASTQYWERLAIIWTYDEAGGFADHVPPPNACLATPSTSPFTLLGPRVPFAVISPWSKRGYVSHVVRDHTAITRFIETVFDLPALTARDANADALLDMFDFTCGQEKIVPPAPPSPGTGGCN